MKKVAMGLLPWFVMLPLTKAVAEQIVSEQEALEDVEVVAVTPLQFGGVDVNKIQRLPKPLVR